MKYKSVNKQGRAASEKDICRNVKKRLAFFIWTRYNRFCVMKRIYNCLGMAQFGSVLEWGSRGRRFKSSYPDHSGVNFMFTPVFLYKLYFSIENIPVMIGYSVFLCWGLRIVWTETFLPMFTSPGNRLVFFWRIINAHHDIVREIHLLAWISFGVVRNRRFGNFKRTITFEYSGTIW